MLCDLLSFDQGYLAMGRLAGGAGLALPVSGIADNTGVGFDRDRVDRQHRFTPAGRVKVQRCYATEGLIFRVGCHAVILAANPGLSNWQTAELSVEDAAALGEEDALEIHLERLGIGGLLEGFLLGDDVVLYELE